MSSRMRIGLVEVGSSNNIRFFVADVDADLAFRPVQIKTVKHPMHPSQPARTEIEAVNAMVAAFIADAERHGCDRLIAYGTEACRAAEREHPGVLSRQIQVLTPKDEALASWVAGFACTNRSPGTQCTIVDLGSGSIEVVNGTWDGQRPTSLAFHSSAIGSKALLEQYRANPQGHVATVMALLVELTGDLERKGVAAGREQQVYLVGGMATNIGWLATRSESLEGYNPAAMNGLELSVDQMNALHQRLMRDIQNDPVAARQAVDPRPGNEEVILQILGNLSFLTILASFLSPGPYRVSGYGVRHGMAFLIRRGLLAP